MIELNKTNFVNDMGIGYGNPIINGSMLGNQHIGINRDYELTPPNISGGQKTGDEAAGINTKETKPQDMNNIKPTEPTEVEKNETITDKEQKELWAREDAIRKETQEREDNINQRMVSDMRKAGMNPNLITGASASGGGITSATKKDLSRIENEKNRELEKIIQLIELNWKGSQADLDRTIEMAKATMGLIDFF